MSDALTAETASPGRDELAPRARRLLPLALALAIALPAVVAVADAMWRSTWAPFGRDQGIFQYVAWAIRHGERDYVDFREINGPFIHVLHLLLLPITGADEHAFRVFDVALTFVVYGAVGAMLPGIGHRRGVTDARPSGVTRAAWALAACVVMGSQYLLFDYWQHAQRESFYVLFLVASLALQMYALRPHPVIAPAWLLALAGALNAVTWFGKPTCVLFAGAQVVALLVDDEREIRAGAALRALAYGALAGAVPMILFVAIVGDLGACARMILVEAPRLYRFIWHKSLGECYSIWNNGPKLNYAFVTLGASALLIAARALPRRFLGIVLFLVVGLITFFVQGKGFPYHLHPITAGTHLLWLAAAAFVAERTSRTVGAALALGGALVLAYQARTEAVMSPSVRNDWYADARATDPDAPERFYRHFQGGDFYPWDMREAARFIDRATSEGDRVQTYGMDPYFLFLARRLSATPYVYSFELNVDAALDGSSGRRPDAAQRTWIVDAARGHEREMLEGLARRPPAAFVLLDKAPFTFPVDSEIDFETHCPEAAAWMRARYTKAATFGAVRVWLRNDRIVK